MRYEPYKRCLLALAILAVLSAFAPANASAIPAILSMAQRNNQEQAKTSACYNIAHSDARTICIARARRDTNQCYSIQRPDVRQQCIAEVSR